MTFNLQNLYVFNFQGNNNTKYYVRRYVQPFLLCFCARMLWGRILNWISQHLEDFDPCYFRQFHECIFFSLSSNCVGAQCSKTLRRACGWWRQGPTKLWIAVHDVVSTRSLLKLFYISPFFNQFWLIKDILLN